MSHPIPQNSSPPQTQLRQMHLQPPGSLEMPPRTLASATDLPSPFSEGNFGLQRVPSRRLTRPTQQPLTLKTTPDALDPAVENYVDLKVPNRPLHHRAYTNSEAESIKRGSPLTSGLGSASTSVLVPSSLGTSAKGGSSPALNSAATAGSTPALASANPLSPSEPFPSPFQSPRPSAVGQAADMQARIMALQRSRSKRAHSQSQSQCASPQIVARRDSGKAEEPALESAFTISPEEVSPCDSEPPVLPKAKNGFDPNTVISPTAASAAATGGAFSLGRAPSFRTRQRSSLSARRGLKLDAMAKEGEHGADTGAAAARGDNTSMGAAPRNSKQAPRGRGLFRDYRKYLDIETGSLRFNGKACVHAQGIEFSSGEKFDISMDKLQFVGELGSGNYGTVQKVLHTRNSIYMAVKEIRLELDESSLQQIIMELDVLHRCETPSIISFYGAFFVEGSVYICMEYMDGGSINKIYEGGVPEKYLKYIVRAVATGLKELKDNFNIIHRDVKPTNILCSTEGNVKLCDFGVSGNLVASMARTNVGCQAYMAPERIKGDRFSAGRDPNQPLTYTTESDIWSLGLSIIEMAKGCYPYPADMYMSIFSQLNAIVEEPSPALDPTRFSPEACDFVAKLLCKRPDQRPNYADILKHPWLATVECTPEEFGSFVSSRLEAAAAAAETAAEPAAEPASPVSPASIGISPGTSPRHLSVDSPRPSPRPSPKSSPHAKRH